MSHISVLADEIISSLQIKTNGIYIDATFGAGGHSRRILESNSSINIIGIDRDSNSIVFANNLKIEFQNRFEFQNILFSDIDKTFDNQVDGIIYDIGVSSMQIDQGDRGFSFNKAGSLSMEMGLNKISAEDIVNDTNENDLANLIYKYGDEKKSRIIARKIVEYRAKKRITDTLELSEIIHSAVGRYNDTIDPSTRTFQAIRIVVNNELSELESSLVKGIKMLKSGGRLCVITFHSLEDRIVKNLFNTYAGKNIANFDRNYNISKNETHSKIINIITKKPIVPSNKEILLNIRARSAKLRIIEKV